MLNRKIAVALSGAMACLTFTMPALSGSFQQVTLMAKDGSSEIRGALIGVEDGNYIINSLKLGTHRIPVELVQCQGVTCPDVGQDQSPSFAAKTLTAGGS